MAITYSSTANQERITLTGGKDTGTATSGSTTALNDTAKSWTVNAYAGRKVWIYGGTGAGQVRRIDSNTATQLVPNYAFDTAPDATSLYLVLYNYADIQAADTAGAWGRTVTQGNQIRIRADVVTGDGTTYSGLADESKQIEIVTGSGFVSGVTLCDVKPNAIIEHGNIDANGKEYGGCSWSLDSLSTSNKNLFGSGSGSGGLINFYDSLLSWDCSVSTVPYIFMRPMGVCTWIGNKIKRHRGGRFMNANCVLRDNIVHDGLVQGFSFNGAVEEASGFRFSREDKAFKIFNTSGCELTDAVFDSETNNYDFYVDEGSTAEAVLVGCLHGGNGLMDDSKLLRQATVPGRVWTGFLDERKRFQMRCIDTSNDPVENFRVAIYDQYGTEVFNDLTDSDGLHTLQKITVTHRTAGGSASTFTKTLYNPLTIKYRKHGFVFFEENIVLVKDTYADKKFLANPFFVADEATSLAYDFAYTKASKLTELTDDITSDFLQKRYDFGQTTSIQSANMDTDIPIETTDGINFTEESAHLLLIAGFEATDASEKRWSGALLIDLDSVIGFNLGTVELQLSESNTPETAYELRTVDISGTLTLVNTSAGDVYVLVGRDVTVDTDGDTTIHVLTDIDTFITAPNITSARYVVHNETTNQEVGYGTVSGAGISQAIKIDDDHHNIGDTIRLSVTYRNGATAKKTRILRGILTAQGVQFIETLEDNTVYNDIGIDGSTVTGITADGIDVEMDIDEPTNKKHVHELYAWWVANEDTYNGLRIFAGGLVAEDMFNFRKEVSVVDWTIDNKRTEDLVLYGARIFASDNSSMKKTGTNPITLDPDKVYTASDIQEDISAIRARIKDESKVSTEDDVWGASG